MILMKEEKGGRIHKKGEKGEKGDIIEQREEKGEKLKF